LTLTQLIAAPGQLKRSASRIETMLIRSPNLFTILICIISLAQVSEAQCRKPKNDEHPHGANEFIILGEKVVGRVSGTVFFPNYMIAAGRERAKDIIVELYGYHGDDSYDSVSKLLHRQKRSAACLTGADGRFAFALLRPGRYLLRAGTRNLDQFNEVHVILVVTTNQRARKRLEIVLPAGT
jgi:hypothetical protein